MKTYLPFVIVVLVMAGAFIFFSPGGTDLTPLEPSATSSVPGPGMRQISVYFSNAKMAGKSGCASVFPVSRTVEDTPGLPREALAALFQGPTETERARGYLSLLNQEAGVQAVSVEDGVAAVDFDRSFISGPATACRTGTAQAEIEATLKQLPGVQTAVISINGASAAELYP